MSRVTTKAATKKTVPARATKPATKAAKAPARANRELEEALDRAADIAECLIEKGHWKRKFSGRTLYQWFDIVSSREACSIKRQFAAAAIKGLAAEIVREWLDVVDVTIRFE